VRYPEYNAFSKWHVVARKDQGISLGSTECGVKGKVVIAVGRRIGRQSISENYLGKGGGVTVGPGVTCINSERRRKKSGPTRADFLRLGRGEVRPNLKKWVDCVRSPMVAPKRVVGVAN